MIYLSSLFVFFIFFFKQKTAYEMRISDWSSDVCSSDLKSKPPPHISSAARQARFVAAAISAAKCALYPGQFSWRACGAAPHNWERPSDSRLEVPIWHDIGRGSYHSASSGGASAFSASCRQIGRAHV